MGYIAEGRSPEAICPILPEWPCVNWFIIWAVVGPIRDFELHIAEPPHPHPQPQLPKLHPLRYCSFRLYSVTVEYGVYIFHGDPRLWLVTTNSSCDKLPELITNRIIMGNNSLPTSKSSLQSLWATFRNVSFFVGILVAYDLVLCRRLHCKQRHWRRSARSPNTN